MQSTNFTTGYTLYNCVCDKYFFSSCSVHPQNRLVIRRCNSSIRDRYRELCFRQIKDVTVPYVPLETYPGSKIVHLIFQRLNIGEQDTW